MTQDDQSLDRGFSSCIMNQFFFFGMNNVWKTNELLASKFRSGGGGGGGDDDDDDYDDDDDVDISISSSSSSSKDRNRLMKIVTLVRVD